VDGYQIVLLVVLPRRFAPSSLQPSRNILPLEHSFEEIHSYLLRSKVGSPRDLLQLLQSKLIGSLQVPEEASSHFDLVQRHRELNIHPFQHLVCSLDISEVDRIELCQHEVVEIALATGHPVNLSLSLIRPFLEIPLVGFGCEGRDLLDESFHPNIFNSEAAIKVLTL
jgi:hypothetical protein